MKGLQVLVCTKIVPDPEGIIISKTRQEISETQKRIIKDPDKCAIETGLLIKQETKEAHLTAVSVCRHQDIDALRYALAMGIDEAQAVVFPEVDNLDESVLSKILYAFIKKGGGFDLILCGEGQTGIRIAHLLGIPFKAYIRQVDVSQLSLPCVLTISHGANRPRLPSAMAIMKAFKREIKKIETGELGLSEDELCPKVVMYSSYLT
jgi:electron transfer flavoprotein beta subunit